MALLGCKECGKEVSSTAKICPNCGVKNPVVKPSRLNSVISRKWIIVVFILVAIGAAQCSQAVKSGSGKAISTSAKSENRADCQIRMKSGALSANKCDLFELCDNKRYFERQKTKYSYEGNTIKQYQAAAEIEKIDRWLLDYYEDDVLRICNPASYRLSHPSTGPETAKKSAKEIEDMKSPLFLFPVGSEIPNGELAASIDKNFPGSKFNADESISINWNGHPYRIQTKKLPIAGSNSPKYEIVSIRRE